MNEVQKTYYPNQFPAFDGKKNLYSYSELPIQRQVIQNSHFVARIDQLPMFFGKPLES